MLDITIRSNKDLTRELRKIGMTNRDFMTLVGYSPNTIKTWKEGKVPVWVTYVVRYLQQTKACAEEANTIEMLKTRKALK